MNVFTLLMLFAVMIAAVFGLAYVGSRTATTPPVDTYGNTTDAATNASQATVGNMSATGQTIGGGALLLVVGIIGAVVIGAMVMIATGKGKTIGRG